MKHRHLLWALEQCVHTQCPAHIHQLSRTQLPTDGRDSQSEAGGFRSSHTHPLNFHLPPIQGLPVSTAVLKTNSSQDALSKDLPKRCQYFDATLDSSCETFWLLIFPQVSPVQTLEAQGCAEWTLAGKWERKVFKCYSHLTHCFGVSTEKGSTTASSDFPWPVPARSRSGGQQPRQSPQRTPPLSATFVSSHKHWTKNIHSNSTNLLSSSPKQGNQENERKTYLPFEDSSAQLSSVSYPM